MSADLASKIVYTSFEKIGEDFVVTILDDSEKGADVQLHVRDGAEFVFIRQEWDNGGVDILSLTANQFEQLSKLVLS